MSILNHFVTVEIIDVNGNSRLYNETLAGASLSFAALGDLEETFNRAIDFVVDGGDYAWDRITGFGEKVGDEFDEFKSNLGETANTLVEAGKEAFENVWEKFALDIFQSLKENFYEPAFNFFNEILSLDNEEISALGSEFEEEVDLSNILHFTEQVGETINNFTSQSMQSQTFRYCNLTVIKPSE